MIKEKILVRHSVVFVRLHRRQFHASIHKYNDYEIDLITLKRRKKIKKENISVNARPAVDDPSKRIVNVSAPRVRSIDEFLGETHNPTSLESTSSKDVSPHTLKVNEINNNLNRIETSINEKFDKFESVLNLISKDSKDNSKLLNELKAKIKEDQKEIKQENTGLHGGNATIHINGEELEEFLKNAKLTKQREEEEHFRESRAFETSLGKSRSLEKRNFFTPINERLIKSVKRGNHPILDNQDDLLFPTIPRSDNRIHEFLILHNKKPIITDKNPLGANYYKPDLMTLMKDLGSSSGKYWKQILKLEKEHWNLIGTEGYDEDNKILIFERYIEKDQLKALQRKKAFKILYKLSFIGVVLYSLGYYFERDEKLKKTDDSLPKVLI